MEIDVTTIEEVEVSLTNDAGVAYSHRGSGKLSAAGCVVYVDVYGRVQVQLERSDADPDRIREPFGTTEPGRADQGRYTFRPDRL
jgi:hypothetical protein